MNIKRTAFLIAIIFLLVAAQKIFASGPIIINEIMYDLAGSDDDHEWVEIKNISSEAINLNDWRFNDGANHLLNEPPKNGGQGSLVILAGEYAILADKADVFLADHPGFSGIVIDTVLNLNNTSGILKIINESGQVIDEANYDKSLGANGDGYSLERISDFIMQFCPSQNLGGSPGSNNNPNCYFKPEPTATPAPTPALTPAPTPTSSPSPFLSPSSAPSLDIEPSPTIPIIPREITAEMIINEFIPNPAGSDEENEWIEIYNAGDNDIDLNGWKLQDASAKTYNFKKEVIKAKNYLVLGRPQTKISINNDAETLILVAPDGTEAFKISFSGGSKEGYSFARFGPNDWRWTKILTPGKANQYSEDESPKIMSNSSVNDSGVNSVASAATKDDLINMLLPLRKVIFLALGVGLIFSLATLVFIKKFIP